MFCLSDYLLYLIYYLCGRITNLTHKDMKNFRVIVYLNEDCKSANKRIFERLLNCSTDSVFIDFNGLVSALRLLFGSKCIVVFELS